MSNTKNINSDRDLIETLTLLEQEKQMKKEERKQRPKKFWIFLGLGIGLIVLATALFIVGVVVCPGKDLNVTQTIIALLWIPFFVASITMFGLTIAVATKRIK